MVYVGFPLKKKLTGNNTGPARHMLTGDKKRDCVYVTQSCESFFFFFFMNWKVKADNRA